MRGFLILIVCSCVITTELSAQEAAGCETAYQEALRLYKDAQFDIADGLADSLSRSCMQDKDQLARILFLRTLIAARVDSVAAMHRDMEALFRIDRNYILKPYDPLLIEIPQRDELYTAYQYLFGSREVGAGLLRKDHGRLRAGFMGGLVIPQLDVRTDRQVFEDDGPNTLTATPGWNAVLLVEYDLFPNWALRVNGGLSRYGYLAKNKALAYKEDLQLLDLAMGIRKSFWFKGQSWVPYLLAGAGLGMLQTVNAHIERSGDGVRLLGPLDADRIAERTRIQYRGIAGAGVAYKIGHTVLSVEGRYEYAFTDHTLPDAPYTESELLTRYYYLDNDLRISNITVAMGIQYIIRYHRRNRFYP